MTGSGEPRHSDRWLADRWLALGGLALVALFVWLGGQLAYKHAYATGHARAETALRLTVNALKADLARYEVVPRLIGDLDLIHALVADPSDEALRAETNLWLARQRAAVAALDIYLILPDGETIAHSASDGAVSFIGENFSYRPYFIEAMHGAPGVFYGVGTTSGVRGYYFSAPVRDARGAVTAVVAVKIGVERIEEAWRGGEYRVLVTDPEGIVFLSSEPEWLYHGIRPLTPERRALTAASQRYASMPLAELPMTRLERYGTRVMRMPLAPGRGESRDYVVASEEMPGAGWTVHVLLDGAEPRDGARLAMLSIAALLIAAGFAAMMWRQRRRQAAERLDTQRNATARLEDRVAARTADLARVNGQLEQEIAERRGTEAELRAAQASLLQAGKLAALGQMSAALSHEINQPLAAARNYADSAAVFIERGDPGRARENIDQILALIDRVAAIGRHLRHAAGKPAEPLGSVALAPLLAETRTIVTPRLASAGAALEIDVPDDLPALRAGPTRLQQVLVNLVTNAADAAEGAADRRITLSARAGEGRVVIRVRDRGPGVPEAIAARIFDPFFTTTGAGLGLGLSITASIVRDFAGTISCHAARPGAEFRVSLPVAEPAGVAA